MKLSDITNKIAGFQRVENLAPNQIIIKTDNAVIFQSYQSIIAIEFENKIYLSDKWDYSKTTGKYRNRFLNEDKKATEKKIQSGEYLILN